MTSVEPDKPGEEPPKCYVCGKPVSPKADTYEAVQDQWICHKCIAMWAERLARDVSDLVD